MFLVVHGAVGIVAGQAIGSPAAAFVAGFLSHALVDIIPHGDTPRAGIQWSKKRLVIAGGIDIILTAVMLGLLAMDGRAVLTIPALAGLAGGITPDLLQVPGLVSQSPIARGYLRVHHFFHNLISSRWELPVIGGMIVQAAVLAITIAHIR